ncbi:MAG TPA: ABC transporter permease, partial [Polyangiaceae bacterium]|nr:ABC transporter permease [Polyangiaceae bacterium]
MIAGAVDSLKRLLNPKSPRGSRPAWLGPLIALLVVYALFMVLSPSTFGRTQNLVTMARQTVVVGIAASGMTLVIIAGGIDLSVGSMVALTTVFVASLLKSGSGPVASAALAVLAATLLGTGTGLLVSSLKIRPFIVTLGAMTMLRGAAKGLAREQKIDVDPRGLDTLLAALPPDRAFLLFPPGVWAMLAVTLLTAGLLNYTRIGLHIFAIGSNEPTAVLAGVAVKRVKVFVY